MWALVALAWPLEYLLRYVLSLASAVHGALAAGPGAWHLWIRPHIFIGQPPWSPGSQANVTGAGSPFPWRHPRPMDIAP